MNSAPTYSLEAEQLACVRGDRPLFAGVEFRLDPGESLIVSGANGAGKTSLLRILAGFIHPAGGEVRWCGTRIHSADGGYRAAVSYIGHASGLKDLLTVRENARVVQATGVTRVGSTIHEVLAEVGLAGYEDEPVRHLSAGQRRRLSLARLLLTQTPLWLLDEPFTALDQDGRALVEQLLARHSRAGGIVALTTHVPVQVEHGVVKTLLLS